MRVTVLRGLGLFFLLTGAALSQPLPTLPTHFYAAGAGYQPGGAATPLLGWAASATLITAKAGLYSFTEWDMTSSTTGKFTPATSERTGIAVWAREIKIKNTKVETFLLFTAGAVTTAVATPTATAPATTSSVTGATGSVGAAATIPLPWYKLMVLGAWEYAGATVTIGSPKTYRLGIGRSWD